jgi:hypothetical protein
MYDVVVCYSVDEEDVGPLRRRLDLVSLGAADAGLSTYVHARDAQAWDLSDADYAAALSRVFEQIRGTRFLLIDATRSTGACLTGMNIEAGYAKALGKPIVALWRSPDRPHKTMVLADFEASYEREDDLRSISRRLLLQAAEG